MELEHIAVRSGRLSSFLKGELNMSTGLMNRLKWTGALLVNGQPARTNTQVTPGDRITALLDDPEPEYPAEDMPLEIRYEDRDLLVVDKPPGMLIHPSRHRMTGTLANGVLGYYRRTGQACAFHPATRLDRDTFGLVLLAKNAHIHRLLNDIHTRGQLHKIYHGLVYGAPPEPEGTIDMPIGRCPKPSLLRRICANRPEPDTVCWSKARPGACWSWSPSPAGPISCGSTAPSWAAPCWETPSTEPRPVKPSPPAWAFPISSSAPGSFTSPTP